MWGGGGLEGRGTHRGGKIPPKELNVQGSLTWKEPKKKKKKKTPKKNCKFPGCFVWGE